MDTFIDLVLKFGMVVVVDDDDDCQAAFVRQFFDASINEKVRGVAWPA